MCVCTTTVQRRGAICIIVNNADDEDSKQYNHLTSCSTDSDDDCSQDDDDDDDDDTDNDNDNDCGYANGNHIDYNYTIVNNNITNKRLNAHKRKANRKYNKIRKLKSPSTAVVVGADVQVHPRQLNFWQNLLVTQKRRQRRRQRSAAMKTASQTSTIPNSSKPIAGNRSKRIIDFFRRSSRDIHRKPGEG